VTFGTSDRCRIHVHNGLVAGRDLKSGGTWVGLGPRGRVAVITNVRDGLVPAFAGPSRGALPVDFLGGDATALAHATALASVAGDYAPFNLMLADAGGCAYVGNHPASGAHTVAPGVHGLSNGAFDAPWPKTRRLREALQAWVDAGDYDPAPLWQALADQHLAPDAELPETGVGLELERRLTCDNARGGVGQTVASSLREACRGKSGLHRARCQVTPGRREPTESATERYRLRLLRRIWQRVKWCGKSAPRVRQQDRHGKPHRSKTK
jgi:uncharacterized protein with NRDE domain